MGKKLLIAALGIVGASFLVMAFFALQLGIGHERTWGPGRIIVAVLGGFLVLLALLIASWHFWAAQTGRIGAFLRVQFARLAELPPILRIRTAFKSRSEKWRLSWKGSALGRMGSALAGSRPVQWMTGSQDRRAGLMTLLLGAVIIFIYLFYVSVGWWTHWPKTTTYYDQLAEAFLHGQTSLLVQPKADLLSLADPYDFKNREHISSYPWDAVLFKGKFYIYWGPAPAVFLAGIKLIFPGEYGDPVVVFGGVSGTFFFASLLLLRIRRRLFPSYGLGYSIPAVMMAGLISPLPWLLNRPAIYEAAISAGQCFLMGGLFFSFRAVDGSRPIPWSAALGSAFFFLAIASRLTLAPAVLFLLLVTAWRILSQTRWDSRRLSALSALALPMAAGLVGLGWYNYLRFGSWLETGMQYQLSGINVSVLGFRVFDPANFLYDLNNYLINPYRWMGIFPYLKPDWGGHFIFFPIPGSAVSNSEQISGMIPTAPYVLFSGVALVSLFIWMVQAVRRRGLPMDSIPDPMLAWTTAALSGAFFLAAAPSWFYMTSSMRYMADSVPLLSLLSTFGFWLLGRILEGKRTALRAILLLAWILMLFSVTASLLLAITGYEARFEHLNPALFEHLTRLLTP